METNFRHLTDLRVLLSKVEQSVGKYNSFVSFS